MTLTRQELKAAIDTAHARHLKITGHLCSVTLREAAELGIDNLEHSIIAASDFVANKEPDVCPGQGVAWSSVAAEDPRGEPVQALLRDLVEHHVAMTSTLSVFEVVGAQS